MTAAVDWTAISAVGTMGAAVAAAVSLFQFQRDYNRKLRAGRPRMRMRESGLKEHGNGYRFETNLMNYGDRVAEDVIFELELVREDLSESLIAERFPIPDDIPPEEKTFPIWQEVDAFAANVPPHLLFVGVQYRDGLLDTRHHQTWLRKWLGVENGQARTNFLRLTDPEEVERARDYFRERIDRLEPSHD